MNFDLKNADTVFKRGKRGFYTRAIKWFTRRRGESETHATHVAMIVKYGNDEDNIFVIESSLTVKMTPFKEWAKKNPNFSIWRMKGLSEREREKIADNAVSHLGDLYGFAKIVLHGIDSLIAKFTGKDWFIFRRLQFADRYPICNWLVACAYYEAIKYKFTYPPKFTDPDSMNDHVRKSGDFSLVMICSSS